MIREVVAKEEEVMVVVAAKEVMVVVVKEDMVKEVTIGVLKTGTAVTAMVNRRSRTIDQPQKNYLTIKVGSLAWVAEGDLFLLPKKEALPMMVVVTAELDLILVDLLLITWSTDKPRRRRMKMQRKMTGRQKNLRTKE